MSTGEEVGVDSTEEQLRRAIDKMSEAFLSQLEAVVRSKIHYFVEFRVKKEFEKVKQQMAELDLRSLVKEQVGKVFQDYTYDVRVAIQDLKLAVVTLKDDFKHLERLEFQEKAVKKPEFMALLDQTIDMLELSVRSDNCLQNANIRYIGELVQRTEAELLAIRNFGRKSLKEIREVLAEMGLMLGLSSINWELPDKRR